MPRREKSYDQQGPLSLTISPMKLSRSGLLVLLVALGFGLVEFARSSKAAATPRAHLSQTISVHASGRGNPSINMSDGRDILTSYSGPAALTQALQRNEAEPLALASADFDEDGVPDLICGYAHAGSGIITWLRGNVDSIYENSPEAQRRKATGEFTDAPFLSPARVFELPIEPEFLGTGDFDADGHWDVVAASRASNALYLLRGDGQGGFGEAIRIALPGVVTAFMTGEINRPDGLTDLVVAVQGQDGPKALVFEGPEGALRASPEVFPLPAEATSLALGQLEGDPMTDLAIAAGNQLLIVQGRDRKLSLSKRSRDNVAGAVINIRDFPYTLRSLAIDYFTSNKRTELAMLSDDGSLSLLRAKGTSGKKATRGVASLQTEVIGRGPWSDLTKLVPARMSAKNVSSILIVDSNSNQIDVVTCDSESDAQQPNKKGFLQTDRFVSMNMATDGGPTAALPMRLNSDALNDLMVLRRGQSVPSVVATTAATTFTVTNKLDSGDGSLRKAIDDSNMNPGPDEIRFNIPGQGPFQIDLLTPLPTVSSPVTIDGATQPGFAGTNVIRLPKGPLTITVGNSVVRGLDIIIDIGGSGINLLSNGNNVIEGNNVISGDHDLLIDNSGNNLIGGVVTGSGNNFTTGQQSIGTFGIKVSGSGNKIQGNSVQATGNGSILIQQGTGNLIGGDVAGAGNVLRSGFDAPAVKISTDLNVIQGNSIIGSRTGVVLFGRNNTIGGTVVAARNLITNNGFADVSSTGDGHVVQGNLIGTDASGTGGGNNGAGDGESVGVGVFGNGNAVGGNVAGARNIIAAHRGSFRSAAGVAIYNGTDNEAVGNFIGTDITGTHALPNTVGVQLYGQSLRSVVEGNVLSGNTQGLFVSGAIGASVQNNLIGVTADAAQPLGNMDGLVVTGAPNTIIENNVISGNSQYGVVLASVSDVLVRNNLIGTTADGIRRLGNARTGVVATQANKTQIEANVISANGEHGVSIGGLVSVLGAGGLGGQTFVGGDGTTVSGNKIGTDIEGIGPLGNAQDGVFVENQSQTHTIEGNIIAFNGRNGVCLPNIPSDPNKITESPAVQIHISQNSIFSNLALGIDLGNPGVTANHFEDPAHHEANHAQNFPVLNRATTDGAQTTLEGNLVATPNGAFTIEFFSNSPDALSALQVRAAASCVPQGQFFLDSITVQTDAQGNAPINVILPASAAGGFINATATSLTGNTSEFSACLQPKFINADLAVGESGPGAVLVGSNLTYQITVANNGPDLATNVVLISKIPNNTTFDSFTAPTGWTSRPPDAGSIICSTSVLPPGTVTAFTLVVKVSAGLADKAIITSSVSVSSTIPDLKTLNNAATLDTIVTLTPPMAANLVLAFTGKPDPVFPGDTITYDLTVKNTGNAAAEKVQLTLTIPSNTTLQSSGAPDGWTRTGPAPGGTGDIVHRIESFPSGAEARFTFVVKVNSTTTAPTNITANASLSSETNPTKNMQVETTVEARPPGPDIQSITVSSTITAIGFGFLKPVQVFIDDMGFLDPAKVKGGARVIQKGKLTDGRSIADAVPPGKQVRIKFRNSDGGETEVSFRN